MPYVQGLEKGSVSLCRSHVILNKVIKRENSASRLYILQQVTQPGITENVIINLFFID